MSIYRSIFQPRRLLGVKLTGFDGLLTLGIGIIVLHFRFIGHTPLCKHVLTIFNICEPEIAF